MKIRFHAYDWVLIGLMLYLLTVQIYTIWPFTIDDMYISLRYAKHWVAGEGLVWNINEAPVEGYSNFSFVGLGALSLLLNINPVVALKWAGLLGLWCTNLFVFLISRFWFTPGLALLPCIGLLLYKGQIIWAVSGLETSVFEALICACVFYIYSGLGYQFFPKERTEFKPLYFIIAGLLLAIAGMTRPETPMLMLCFFLCICLDMYAAYRQLSWKNLAAFLLPLITIFLPYFIWRWHYYGFLLPNSVYCKGFANNTWALDIEYLKLIWPLGLFAAFACWYNKDSRYYFLALPSLLYLICLIGADPIVAFDNRFFLPAFALLVPLAWIGIYSVVFVYFKTMTWEATASFYLVSCLVAVFCIPYMTLNQYREFTKHPLSGEQVRTQLVHWLEKHGDKEARVVLADAGLIPYQSSLNFIDSYCLNNLAMTKYPKKQRYVLFCQQMVWEQPEIIILTSLSTPKKIRYTPADRCLKLMINNQGGYKLAKTWVSEHPDSAYRYELFTKL